MWRHPATTYDGTLAAIATLIAEVESRWGEASGVGIGTPGAIDPATGLMKNANSRFLNGRPFATDIATTLGREVRIANDADCLVLSEVADGAGEGADPVFAVILGTGVGGGLFANGGLVRGPNAIAGEWGHNPLPWPRPDESPGPSCYCGKTGCVETFVSGPGVAADFEPSAGITYTAGEVAVAAERGNPSALAAIDRLAGRLGRALAAVINVVDPEVIVLGGGLSNIESLYESVPEAWSEFVFSPAVVTTLARARHRDSSGVRGAARLWEVSR